MVSQVKFDRVLLFFLILIILLVLLNLTRKLEPENQRRYISLFANDEEKSKGNTLFKTLHSVYNATSETNAIGTAPIETIVSPRTNNEIDPSSDIKKQALCPQIPPGLGPVPVNKRSLNLTSLDFKFSDVSLGGLYRPLDCEARHRVAIIVPFRNRFDHLAIFLNHMHPFLKKQQIEYGIYVIEQRDSSEFNRAKLLNVGFVESNRLKPGHWQCFVFHDVDLLPTDARNLYTCPKQPRHMSVAIDKLHYRLWYPELFGGVTAMTYEQFTRVNGYSNNFWGWGAEDDDMAERLNRVDYHIGRYKMSVARYTMLDHKAAKPNPEGRRLYLEAMTKDFYRDGLSSLKYEVENVIQYRLFTLVSVNITSRASQTQLRGFCNILTCFTLSILSSFR